MPYKIRKALHNISKYAKKPVTSIKRGTGFGMVEFAPTSSFLNASALVKSGRRIGTAKDTGGQRHFDAVAGLLAPAVRRKLVKPSELQRAMGHWLAGEAATLAPLLENDPAEFQRRVEDEMLRKMNGRLLSKGTVRFDNASNKVHVVVAHLRRPAAWREGKQTVLDSKRAAALKEHLLSGTETGSTRDVLNKFKSANGSTSLAVGKLLGELSGDELVQLLKHRLVVTIDPGDFILAGMRHLDLSKTLTADGKLDEADGIIDTVGHAFFRKRLYQHMTSYRVRTAQSNTIAHGMGTAEDKKQQLHHRDVHNRGDQQFMAHVANAIRREAKKLGKEVLLVVGDGKSSRTATSRCAALVEFLSKDFLLVKSSEHMSSKMCPGCGTPFCNGHERGGKKNDSFTYRTKECLTDGCPFRGRWNRDDIAPLTIGIIWLYKVTKTDLPSFLSAKGVAAL